MRFSFSFFPLFYMDSHLLLWKLSPSPPPPPSSFDTATSNNESNAIDSFDTLLPTLVLPAILVLSIIYLLYHRHRRQATNPLDLKQDVLQQDAILPDDNNNDDDESLCHQQHQQQEFSSSSNNSRYCKHLQLVLSCIVATGWLCCMMMVDVYAAVYFVIWVTVVMCMWCTFVCVCV